MPTINTTETLISLVIRPDGKFRITHEGRLNEGHNEEIIRLARAGGQPLITTRHWEMEQTEFAGEPTAEEAAAAEAEREERKRRRKEKPGTDITPEEPVLTPGQLVHCNLLVEGHSYVDGCEQALLIAQADELISASNDFADVLTTCQTIPWPHVEGEGCQDSKPWGLAELLAADEQHVGLVTELGDSTAAEEPEAPITVWACERCHETISEEQSRGEGEAHICPEAPAERPITQRQRSRTAEAMAKAAEESANAVTLTPPSTNGHGPKAAPKCGNCDHADAQHRRGINTNCKRCDCPAFFETPIEVGLKLSQPVDVKMNDNPEEWKSALIIGFRPGLDGEDFQRVDVQFGDGREVKGCHPECIRPAVERELANA